MRDCLPPGRVSSAALRAISRADLLIANSEYTRRTLGAAAAQAKVVYNAVDLASFGGEGLEPSAARARLGLAHEDRPVLAVVAQITPWKGQDDAIEIARLLLPSYPGLKLLLVGSPKFDNAATRYDNASFQAGLERQAAALAPADTVRFLGERDDIPEVLRAVDLLLVPSWEEPFGRAVVEAMAVGVPVVATAVGGPPEIVELAGGGLTQPPRRPDLWATEIEALLADPARLAAMSASARREVPGRFGAARHAEEMRRIYDTVIARSAPR